MNRSVAIKSILDLPDLSDDRRSATSRHDEKFAKSLRKRYMYLLKKVEAYPTRARRDTSSSRGPASKARSSPAAMAAAAADGPTEVECVRPKHTHTRRENRRLTAPSVVCFVSRRLLQQSITELKAGSGCWGKHVIHRAFEPQLAPTLAPTAAFSHFLLRVFDCLQLLPKLPFSLLL